MNQYRQRLYNSQLGLSKLLSSFFGFFLDQHGARIKKLGIGCSNNPGGMEKVFL